MQFNRTEEVRQEAPVEDVPISKFRSKDVSLCAYLVVNHPLSALEIDEHGKVVFIFVETDLLKKDVDDYFRGVAQVSPIRYAAELQNMRQLIHSKLHSST